MLEFIILEEESILSALIGMLANPVDRSRHGQDVVLMLTLLVNYHKYEVDVGFRWTLI